MELFFAKRTLPEGGHEKGSIGQFHGWNLEEEILSDYRP